MSAEPITIDDATRLLAALRDGEWHAVADLKRAGVLPIASTNCRLVRQLVEDGDIERGRLRSERRLRLRPVPVCSCGRRRVLKSGECVHRETARVPQRAETL